MPHAAPALIALLFSAIFAGGASAQAHDGAVMASLEELRPYLGVWESQDGAARQQLEGAGEGDQIRIEGRLFFRSEDGWSLVSRGRYWGHGANSSLAGHFEPVGDVEMGFDALVVAGYDPATVTAPGLPPFEDGLVFVNSGMDGDQHMLTIEHWTPPEEGRFAYSIYRSGGTLWEEWFSGSWTRLEERPE